MDAITNSTILCFISNHWLDLLILAAGIVIFYMLVRRALMQNDSRAWRIIYALVLSAEKYLGSKTGQVKKDQVLAWFYGKYPLLAIFLPKSEVDRMIEAAVFKINRFMQINDIKLFEEVRGDLDADL